jgi:hypothetical protein
LGLALIDADGAVEDISEDMIKKREDTIRYCTPS